MGTNQNATMFMIPSTGNGSGFGGYDMHYGCDFISLGKSLFAAIGQIIFILQVQEDFHEKEALSGSLGCCPLTWHLASTKL